MPFCWYISEELDDQSFVTSKLEEVFIVHMAFFGYIGRGCLQAVKLFFGGFSNCLWSWNRKSLMTAITII